MFVHEKEREAEREAGSESGGESGCHQQAPQPAEVRGHHVWKGRPRSNSLPVPHALGVLGITGFGESDKRKVFVAAGHVNVSQGAGGPKLFPEDRLLDLHDALQANKHAKTHRGEKRGLKQEEERVDYEAGKDEEDRHSH